MTLLLVWLLAVPAGAAGLAWLVRIALDPRRLR